MSGRRIDDHSFWAGKPEKGMVMPKGAHVKEMSSDGHAGEVSMYEDTSEAIEKQQKTNEKKIRGHAQKSGYRY